MCIIVNIHVQLTLDNYVSNVFEFQLSQFENIWKNAHIEYVQSYFYKHSLNNIVYQQLQEVNYKQSRDDSKYVDRWTWLICKCCLDKCMGLEHLNTLYPWGGILELASQPWGGTSIHNEMFLEIPSMFIALFGPRNGQSSFEFFSHIHQKASRSGKGSNYVISHIST